MSVTYIRTPGASPQTEAALRAEVGQEGPRARRALGGIAVALAAAAALLGALVLAGCSGSAGNGASQAAPAPAEDAKVKVVTSFYAMQDFATKVGGDHVEVTNLVPAGTEPHDWEPSPTDIATIQDADLLVYNGASMEGWVDDTLESMGDQAPTSVKASDGIELRAGDEHEHEHEAEEGHDHDHGTYDPHVWLSPENAKKELENIKNALVEVDPEHKDDYEANYEKYAAEFDQLDQEFAEKLSAAPNKTIVVSHEAFGYLADAYGLTQVAITGMDAEGEPDAQTMAQIIDQVKASGVKYIFSEDLVSPKVAQQIADATGAECVVLNPLEGLTDEQIAAGDDYVSVMESNLDELVKALS